jgi:hypothetical protein
MRSLALAAAVLVLAGCAHAAKEPGPPASPSPSPAPRAALATPPPAEIPAVTPAPGPFRYVLAPPPPAPGSPTIAEIALSDQTLHPGGPYVVRVLTSPDVTSMLVSTLGQTYALPPDGPGKFFASGLVPSEVPFFFLNRDYRLTATAQTADGRTTSVQVTVRLER